MITIVIKRSLTKKTKKSLVFSVPWKIKRYSKDHGNKITNAVVYARPFQNPIIRYGFSFFSDSLFKFYAQNPIHKAYNKPQSSFTNCWKFNNYLSFCFFSLLSALFSLRVLPFFLGTLFCWFMPFAILNTPVTKYLIYFRN